MANAPRILIADDHPLVRAGLQAALSALHPALHIDAAGNVAEAEAMLRAGGNPRLVLLDYVLPDAHGFSGFFRLQHVAGRTPIAILAAGEGSAIVSAARAVGAAGVLAKTQSVEEIGQAVSALLAGRLVFPAALCRSAEIDGMKARLAQLSSAQRRVLSALVNGHLNKQIAGELHVTEATVKAHLTAIFRKLGVSNRLQAILATRPLLAPDSGE